MITIYDGGLSQQDNSSKLNEKLDNIVADEIKKGGKFLFTVIFPLMFYISYGYMSCGTARECQMICDRFDLQLKWSRSHFLSILSSC